MAQSPQRPTAPSLRAAEPADTPLSEVPTFVQHEPPAPPPPNQGGKQRWHPARIIRSMRAAFRAFPIMPPPTCRSLPHLPGLNNHPSFVKNHFHGSTRTTGTLYGRRRSRITIAFHDSPGSPPVLLLEIGVPTAKFIQDVSAAGMVRVTLECDKHQHQQAQQRSHPSSGELPPRRLLDETSWAAEVNGESVGHAARREPTEDDDRVMRLLHATSMGAGVLPDDAGEPGNGEVTYMRAFFDRVVGSKDVETYYMHNPEGCVTGPELTIFFVRT